MFMNDKQPINRQVHLYLGSGFWVLGPWFLVLGSDLPEAIKDFFLSYSIVKNFRIRSFIDSFKFCDTLKISAMCC